METKHTKNTRQNKSPGIQRHREEGQWYNEKLLQIKKDWFLILIYLKI